MSAAETDPTLLAADQRSFARMELHLDGAPEAMSSPFSSDDSPTRYRIAGSAVRVEVAGRWWTSKVSVTILGSGPVWARMIPGQRIQVSGLLRRDDFPVMPAVLLTARSDPVQVEPAPWWQAAGARIRAELQRTAATLDPDPAGLLRGLVVGDTGGIDERLETDAKVTGLAHLLAVSGSHFALLCGAAVSILRRAGPKVAAAGGAAVLVGLVVLVGPEPSVLRAAVMGGIGVLAMLSGRTRTALPALAAGVIGLLLVDPGLALSVGFTLSVFATAGLVLVAPVWSAAMQDRGVPRGWADLLAIPLAAQAATLPVIVALSGAVSLAAVPANLLAAPVVPPALVIGMLAALVGPSWPAGAEALAQVASPGLSWIASLAHTFARLPSASIPWPATTVGLLVLVAALVFGVLALRRRQVRRLAAAAVAGVLAVMLPFQVVPPPGWPVAGWLLTACEVGQGDALALATDEPGAAVVVDTGPDPVLVRDCLDRNGIGTVPLLIITHLHADHVDGLAGVLEGRTVGAIGVGPGRDPVGAWRRVTALAADRGIPVVELRPGTHWSAGGLSLDVLGPSAPFLGTDSDLNNDSVVFRAERAGVSMLLTGDIEIEAQQRLLDSGTDLRADVLKVPHHGSARTLPTFLQAVSADVAVIGVGADNDYGHPSGRLLNALTAAGVSSILRTDRQGDVAVCLVDGVLSEAAIGARLPSLQH